MTDFLSELWIGLLVAAVLGALGLVGRGIVQAVRNSDIDPTALRRPILVLLGGTGVVVGSLIFGWALMHLCTWLVPWGLDAADYFSAYEGWPLEITQEARDAALELGGSWRWWGTVLAVLIPGFTYSVFAEAELGYRPGAVHQYVVPGAICLVVMLLTAGAAALHLGVNWYLGSAVPRDFPMPDGLTGSLPWDVSWTAYLAGVAVACWAINVTVTWLTRASDQGASTTEQV